MPSQIQLENVSQSFSSQTGNVTLFEHLNLVIKQGHSYAITGPSGAGKSSLLMILAGLTPPSTGEGTYLTGAQSQPLSAMKMDIGFVFQQFHLLPELDALNNIALPMKLRGDKDALEKAAHWLHKVGLGQRGQHKPSELSGGEQQRVAIARALVFNPKFIFADEPTGNLDKHNAEQVTELLFACCQSQQAGLVIVTHSDLLARRTDYHYALDGGQLRCANRMRSVKSA
ncbi:ABC transporter ATP-binding protein [Shewanella waksmanii]|uniref:ABC transporter ATP-binding protein n=1 Tax=Shewanella waksmanii TaxID=213783 RepID=UPI0037359F61